MQGWTAGNNILAYLVQLVNSINSHGKVENVNIKVKEFCPERILSEGAMCAYPLVYTPYRRK